MRKVLTTLSLKIKHTKRMDGHETNRYEYTFTSSDKTNLQREYTKIAVDKTRFQAINSTIN